MNESGQGFEQERPVPRTDGYQPIRAAAPERPPSPRAPQAPEPVPERAPPPAPAPERPQEDAVNFGGEEGEQAETPEERERREALDDPLAHPLGKPIEAHGEQITILRWREPTGGDIEKAGNPISIELEPNSGRYRVSFDEKKMTAMIVQLARIPPHSVRDMRAGDWTAVATKIFRFFA